MHNADEAVRKNPQAVSFRSFLYPMQVIGWFQFDVLVLFMIRQIFNKYLRIGNNCCQIQAFRRSASASQSVCFPSLIRYFTFPIMSLRLHCSVARRFPSPIKVTFSPSRLRILCNTYGPPGKCANTMSPFRIWEQCSKTIQSRFSMIKGTCCFLWRGR